METGDQAAPMGFAEAATNGDSIGARKCEVNQKVQGEQLRG